MINLSALLFACRGRPITSFPLASRPARPVDRTQCDKGSPEKPKRTLGMAMLVIQLVAYVRNRSSQGLRSAVRWRILISLSPRGPLPWHNSSFTGLPCSTVDWVATSRFGASHWSTRAANSRRAGERKGGGWGWLTSVFAAAIEQTWCYSDLRSPAAAVGVPVESGQRQVIGPRVVDLELEEWQPSTTLTRRFFE